MNVTTLAPVVKEEFGKHIKRVVDIPSANLMAVICGYGEIRVFTNDAAEKHVHTFSEHVGQVYLFHLCGDVLCSMGRGGNVITWLASSGAVLEAFNVVGSVSMCKLSDTDLGVILESGSMLVLTHVKGRGIKQLREISLGVSVNIRDARVKGSDVVLVGDNGTAEIWNYLTQQKVGTLHIYNSTDKLDASEEYVAFASSSTGTLRVYYNGGEYAFLESIFFKDFLPPGFDKKWAHIRDIVFISSKLVAVTCKIGIYFVSLPSLEVKDLFVFGHRVAARSISIMHGGIVYAVGMKGYCTAFQAPSNWREDIKAFADRLYRKAAPWVATASNKASPRSEVGDRPPGFRKRTRRDFEREAESAQDNIQAVATPSAPVIADSTLSDEEVDEIEGESVQKTKLSNGAASDPMATSSSSSNEGVEKESESIKGGEVQNTEKSQGAVIEKMKDELQPLKLMLVKKEWEIQKIVSDLKRQKEAMKAMEERVNQSAGVLIEDMRNMQEKSRTEAAAQKEAMNRVKADLEAQKEAVRKMQENANVKSSADNEKMSKIKKESETLRVENEKLQQRNELLEHIIRNLLDKK